MKENNCKMLKKKDKKEIGKQNTGGFIYLFILLENIAQAYVL